jgi:hypothetical protein
MRRESTPEAVQTMPAAGRRTAGSVNAAHSGIELLDPPRPGLKRSKIQADLSASIAAGVSATFLIFRGHYRLLSAPDAGKSTSKIQAEIQADLAAVRLPAWISRQRADGTDELPLATGP